MAAATEAFCCFDDDGGVMKIAPPFFIAKRWKSQVFKAFAVAAM